MFGLGPGVKVHQTWTALPPLTVRAEACDLAVAAHAAPLLAATSRAMTLAFEAPASRAGAIPTCPVASQVMVPKPVAGPERMHAAALPPFVAPTRCEGPLGAPRVHQDLDLALEQLVRKRMLPAARLSPESARHWTQRLADSKKMARTRLELLGLFPDVPLADDAPVRLQAGMLAYSPPTGPIKPSTVVVARRTDSGEQVVGRFYRT